MPLTMLCFPGLRLNALTRRQARHKGMGGMGWIALPQKKKLAFLGPPFITHIRVVFLYLNVEQKNYIHGCADMCTFSKVEKPFWSPGAKFEANILVRNKVTFQWEWGWG